MKLKSVILIYFSLSILSIQLYAQKTFNLDTLIKRSLFSTLSESPYFSKENLTTPFNFEEEVQRSSWYRHIFINVDSQFQVKYHNIQDPSPGFVAHAKDKNWYRGRHGVISPNKEVIVVFDYTGESDTKEFAILLKGKEGFHEVMRYNSPTYYDGPDVRFSKDQKHFVVSNPYGRNFFTFDINTKIVKDYPDYKEFGIPVVAPGMTIKTSSHGKYLTIITYAGTGIFNTETEKLAYYISLDGQSTTIPAAFSADESLILFYGGIIKYFDDPRINIGFSYWIFNINTGKPVAFYMADDSLNNYRDELELLHSTSNDDYFIIKNKKGEIQKFIFNK